MPVTMNKFEQNRETPVSAGSVAVTANGGLFGGDWRLAVNAGGGS